MTQKYEGIFILNPELAEDAIAAQIEKIKEIITTNTGQIEEVSNWGRRKLVYAVKKKRDAIYVFYLFVADPAGLKEMDRRIKLTETIIRYLIVIHDPEKKRISLKRRKREFIKLPNNGEAYIDYKGVDVLAKFLTDRGKIIPRRMSGLSSKDQRKITTAIKRARFLALLPYVDEFNR